MKVVLGIIVLFLCCLGVAGLFTMDVGLFVDATMYFVIALISIFIYSLGAVVGSKEE